MRKVEPEVFLVASTEIKSGFDDYMDSIDQSEWDTDSRSDADTLTEIAGRLCYRSWSPYDPTKSTEATNPNVTRVREGNLSYIKNLLGQMHGSVLEHASITFMFKNVSRVFTHELVRHRAGMAYSQESLRYVLLTDLGFWLPPDMPDFVNTAFIDVYQYVENVQKHLAEKLGLDRMGFEQKKLWTSRLRRLVPMGVGTGILATGNLRAWRHIFTMRSSPGAEEEIRMVQGLMAPMLMEVAPNAFHDLKYDEVNKTYYFEGHPSRGV